MSQILLRCITRGRESPIPRIRCGINGVNLERSVNLSWDGQEHLRDAQAHRSQPVPSVKVAI